MYLSLLLFVNNLTRERIFRRESAHHSEIAWSAKRAISNIGMLHSGVVPRRFFCDR